MRFELLPAALQRNVRCKLPRVHVFAAKQLPLSVQLHCSAGWLVPLADSNTLCKPVERVKGYLRLQQLQPGRAVHERLPRAVRAVEEQPVVQAVPGANFVPAAGPVLPEHVLRAVLAELYLPVHMHKRIVSDYKRSKHVHNNVRSFYFVSSGHPPIRLGVPCILGNWQPLCQYVLRFNS